MELILINLCSLGERQGVIIIYSFLLLSELMRKKLN